MSSTQTTFSFHCSLCSQVFQKPCCLTNCGHTFCFDCLKKAEKLNQRPGDQVIVICPSCHSSSNCLEMETAHEELHEPVVETLIQVLGREKVRSENGACVECSHLGQFWCNQCRMNFCEKCVQPHSQLKFLQNHKLVPLSDKKTEILLDCPTCNVVSSSFCETCKRLVCGRCIVREHKSHTLVDVVEELKQRRHGFKTFIQEVKEKYDQSTHSLSETERVKKALLEQLEIVEKRLKQQTKRTKVLKTTLEKLKCVDQGFKDGQLEVDTFLKLEENLRKKLDFEKKAETKREPTFEESSTVLKNKEELDMVLKWVEEARGGEKVKEVKLLFQGSRDGFNSKNFHEKCDGKGATLILFKTKEGRRGGGYTPVQWCSPQRGADWGVDPKGNSFLFSVDNRSKYPLKSGHNQYAIVNDSGCGPAFGYGSRDLILASECHQNNRSICYPSSYMFSSSQDIVGSEFNFFVQDYEVCQII